MAEGVGDELIQVQEEKGLSQLYHSPWEGGVEDRVFEPGSNLQAAWGMNKDTASFSFGVWSLHQSLPRKSKLVFVIAAE